MSSLLHGSRESKMKEIVKSFDKPINMLEIGTWFGTGSMKLWLNELQPDSTLTVMDLWRPFSNDKMECFENNGNLEKAYEGWKSTIDEIKKFEETNHHKIIINLIRGDSKPLLEQFQSGIFDLIYIDGDHKYDGCYYDMFQSKKLVKDGGIICGDDYETIVNENNVESIRLDGNKKQVRNHPGVGLAIYDCFREVNSEKGFWWIYKKDGLFVK